MKKKYLTWAGIISAVVLISMFIVISLTTFPSPFLFPAITIDPITSMNVDDNNMMILTGTTTLPLDSYIDIKVSALPQYVTGGDVSGKTTATGNTQIISGAGGSNRWNGFVDISQLQPADYMITLATIAFTENFTMVERDPIATQHFTLGDENAGPGSIRKKTVIKKPFIRVNAIDEKETGNRETITGITSLEPGTSLLWMTEEIGNETGSGLQCPRGTTNVEPGTENVNRWSVVFDTVHMRPAHYRISVTDNTGNNTQEITPEGGISAVSEFNLTPPVPGTKNTTDPLGTSSRFVTIDTLPDMRIHDIYLITGTTSLPPGEDLLVQVYPSSFRTDYDFTINPKDKTQGGSFSGAMGGVRIVNGSGVENLWSFELRTYLMDPSIYEVNVSNDKIDFQPRETIPGDVFSSKKFTLKG
ncbi:MAG: hypothetical protein PHD25_12795 [Bacteroidales bacterium]|nr:hypothetical protein [Bacteroidales bacterium]